MNKNILYALLFVLCASTCMGAMDKDARVKAGARNAARRFRQLAEFRAIKKGTCDIRQTDCTDAKKKMHRNLGSLKYARRTNQTGESRQIQKEFEKLQAWKRKHPEYYASHSCYSFSGSDSESNDAVSYTPKRF